MARIVKMKWFTSGPVPRRLNAKQRQEMERKRAERETVYRDMYAEVASHIQVVPSVDLAEETMGYLIVHTAIKGMDVQVFHPREIENASGNGYWSISYGDSSWDQITYEDYPANTSAADIAYRVGFLVNIVSKGRADGRRKNSPRMVGLVGRMLRRIEPYPIADEIDRKRYAEYLATR